MKIGATSIPTRLVGPIKIIGPVLEEEVFAPLATFETPLWPSANRGAKISRLAAGIKVAVVDDRMTRSILVQGADAPHIASLAAALKQRRSEMSEIVQRTSRFAALEDWHIQIVGNLLYIRFAITTGDASGHNMSTKAADALLFWLLEQYPGLEHISVSGNFCTDKKASAVNGILGRGKYVVAEILVPRHVCEEILHTSPEKIVDLNVKKNLIGTMLAGGIRSANAHFANLLLALYLATGQDGANIVEGSQGIVHAETRSGDLYFSATLPNVIVGTVGNGKDLPFAKENLKALGCLEPRKPGENGKRLAAIAGAVVLCGELSLLAAQTRPGELTKSHLRLERSKTCSQPGSTP